MKILSLDDAKGELAHLVSAWKSDAIPRWDMIEVAEEIENHVHGIRTLSSSDTAVADLVSAALDLLANAHHQHVLPQDVPVFEALLSASEATSAIETFASYWSELDYSSRQAEARLYWFGAEEPNEGPEAV